MRGKEGGKCRFLLRFSFSLPPCPGRCSSLALCEILQILKFKQEKEELSFFSSIHQITYLYSQSQRGKPWDPGEEKKTAVKADILPPPNRRPSPLSFGHLPTPWGVTQGFPLWTPPSFPSTPSCQLLLPFKNSRLKLAIARET